MTRSIMETGAIILQVGIAMLFLMSGVRGGHAAPAITCSTGGNFGTVSTDPTISGPNNISMDTNGNITYSTYLSGPATGTPITCAVSGFGNADSLRIDCEVSKTISNSGGCCGTTDRTMTGFVARGVGSTSSTPTACNGLGGAGSGSFKTTAAGTGTVYLGGTMDATHVKTGGTYKLSNAGTGKISVQVRKGGTITGPSTADFSVAFTSNLSIPSKTNMDFGVVGVTGTPTSSERVDLGTNGTAVYAGNFSAQGGTLTAGSVTIGNVQNGVTVEIYCDSSITLTKSGGGSIQVTGMKAAAEGSTGTYAGAGSACNGSGGAAATTMVYNAGSADQFFLGGRLNGGTAASFSGGTYSSANPGGTSATVIVLNQ